MAYIRKAKFSFPWIETEIIILKLCIKSLLFLSSCCQKSIIIRSSLNQKLIKIDLNLYLSCFAPIYFRWLKAERLPICTLWVDTLFHYLASDNSCTINDCQMQRYTACNAITPISFYNI